MANDNTLRLTDGTWDAEVLNSDVPVLVDFWAEWCPPCRTISHTVDTVAQTYAGRVKVGKLNIDENVATHRRYVVRSIPTLPHLQKMLDAHL